VASELVGRRSGVVIAYGPASRSLDRDEPEKVLEVSGRLRSGQRSEPDPNLMVDVACWLDPTVIGLTGDAARSVSLLLVQDSFIEKICFFILN
jgi:hypothetical protein